MIYFGLPTKFDVKIWVTAHFSRDRHNPCNLLIISPFWGEKMITSALTGSYHFKAHCSETLCVVVQCFDKCATDKRSAQGQKRVNIVQFHLQRCWNVGRKSDQMGVQTSGVNTRVHEGCHAKVGQDEEEDQAIVEGHSGGDDLHQPGTPKITHKNNATVEQEGFDHTYLLTYLLFKCKCFQLI